MKQAKDGHIEEENIICGVHGWEYRFDTGVSEYNNNEVLRRFSTPVEEDVLYVDLNKIKLYLWKIPNHLTWGIPQGYKIAASHIVHDIHLLPRIGYAGGAHYC